MLGLHVLGCLVRIWAIGCVVLKDGSTIVVILPIMLGLWSRRKLVPGGGLVWLGVIGVVMLFGIESIASLLMLVWVVRVCSFIVFIVAKGAGDILYGVLCVVSD